MTPGLKRLFFLILAVGAALVFIRYAEIVKDGDLWFHLAYGRYMVEHRTLIPDHTIYSWSPASQDKIYCAWTAEILLYAMHSLGGVPVLFVFRYLCIFAFLALLLLSMKRNHALLNPLAWLMLLTGVYMCRSALDIKPEILSFVFMSLTVWSWLQARSSGASWRYFYLIPAVMLVWVNTHGGFIFGMVFLACVAAGEILNFLLSPAQRLGRASMRHLLASLLLSLAVVFITPYGPAYPLQLFRDLVLDNAQQLKEFRTVGAYQSIFHEAAAPLHFVDYLAVSSGVLALLFWPHVLRKRINWALLLPVIGMAALYVQFIRTTYFFGVLSCFIAVELLKTDPGQPWPVGRRVRVSMGALAVALCVLLSSRETVEAVCRPSFGFGLNFYSPVQETLYIRDNLLGYRLGNDYNCGTYLLWALWPDAKVFIDARYFPYRQWYREYAEFVYGRDMKYKDGFLAKYGCQTWCATYDFPRLSYFLHSPRWRLVHYGPSACIFALKGLDLPVGKTAFSGDISSIPAQQSLKVLNFAVSAHDLDSAVRIARGMNRGSCDRDTSRQISLSFIRLGDALNKNRRTQEAIHFFQEALSAHPSSEPAVYTTLGALHLRASDFDRAVASFRKALELKPGYAPALSNLAHAYAQKKEYGRALEYLNELVRISPGTPENYYNIACIYARWGKPETALQWLALAVEKGFSNREMLEADSDLAQVRKLDGFRDILPPQ